MNRAERRARGHRGPITWCDCCQDAPATVTVWECPDCGFFAIAPIEMAEADPEFATSCPNCDPEGAAVP